MSSNLKQIQFKRREGDQSFFDMVSLSDLMELKPADHSQFEHHRLTFFVLFFVIEGNGTHNVNFVDYPFEKGTVFTIGKNNIQKFYRSNSKGILLVFTEDLVLEHLSEYNASRIFQLFNELLTSPKHQLTDDDFAQVNTHIEAIKDELSRVKDAFSMDMIRSRLQMIFTQLHRLKSSKDQVFNDNKYLNSFLKFQGLVEEQYQSHKSVSNYADQLCITPRTLNNITNAVVGKSAKHVINDILLSKSKRLLINSTLNISQIAFEIGFQEISHFSKFFHQHAGCSPKQFRTLFKQ